MPRARRSTAPLFPDLRRPCRPASEFKLSARYYRKTVPSFKDGRNARVWVILTNAPLAIWLVLLATAPAAAWAIERGAARVDTEGPAVAAPARSWRVILGGALAV